MPIKLDLDNLAVHPQTAYAGEKYLGCDAIYVSYKNDEAIGYFGFKNDKITYYNFGAQFHTLPLNEERQIVDLNKKELNDTLETFFDTKTLLSESITGSAIITRSNFQEALSVLIDYVEIQAVQNIQRKNKKVNGIN